MESVSVTRTLDDSLDALGHVQRRQLLSALLDHSSQNDDSVKINAKESDQEELNRLIGMKHVHLPKLESYGFVDWNQDTNEVSKGSNFQEIRPLVQMLVDHEDELPDEWL